MIMNVGIMPRNEGINMVPITSMKRGFLKRNSNRAKAYPPMEQNNSVSPVEARATYKLQPRLRQNGILLVRRARLLKNSLPKNKGGGKLKISVREWVANTNMK